jgi:hypothetical protein
MNIQNAYLLPAHTPESSLDYRRQSIFPKLTYQLNQQSDIGKVFFRVFPIQVHVQ